VSLAVTPLVSAADVASAAARDAVAAADNARATAAAELVSRQKQVMSELRTEMDALPDVAPTDGLGGADHDSILYGKV